MPTHITLEEQGLRDGLQTLQENVPLQTRMQYINMLIAAGVKRIQVASFVHPKLVPQMAMAAELFAALPKNKKVIFSALVLNTKGVERAIESGVKHLSISLSASEAHSLKNANKTIEAAKEDFKNMVELALANNIKIRGGVQCAFGCRYQGEVSEDLVLDLVAHHLACGVHEVALADSTGMANPIQIKSVMNAIKKLCGNTPVALHLHNTENLGYANMLTAIEVGITQFDTAFGGLGGCPFIPNATGNIATEDVINILHKMNYETGIDINKISEISRNMEQFLGYPLPGLLYKLNV
jgi:hydroxymethylglutaryl-CoA lyase